MKKILFALFAILISTCAFAQVTEVMVVRQTDGKEVSFNVSDVEKVYFSRIEAVDLGLPSGIKWASCNLGAVKPEACGNYYGWGCLEPYKDTDYADWPLYLEMIGSTGKSEKDCGTDLDPLKDYVFPNQLSISGTKWDVAHAQLGGTWRMPTDSEISELMKNCIWTWVEQQDGLKGYEVKSKTNGNSIFVPITGYRSLYNLYEGDQTCYFWSSTPEIYESYYVYGAWFSGQFQGFVGGDRCMGLPVRPVCD